MLHPGSRYLSAVETKLAAELKIDERAFLGLPLEDNKRTDGCYLFGKFEQGSIANQIDLIYLSNYGLFANSLIQFANALVVAKSLGVRHICHEGREWIHDLVEVDGIRIEKCDPFVNYSESRVLKSAFYYKQTFKNIISEASAGGIISRVRDTKPLLKYPQWSGERFDDDSILWVHLRAGDVFEGKVHPRYGQPPLCFYLSIIESRKWEKINLVFENSKNPCTKPIIEYLINKNIKFQVFSGSLRDDLEKLFTARNLVAGRGTFCIPIIAMSSAIRRVYSFENNILKSLGGVDDRGVVNFRFCDRAGEYEDLLRAWCCSEAQVHKMLNYPAQSIGLI